MIHFKYNHYFSIFKKVFANFLQIGHLLYYYYLKFSLHYRQMHKCLQGNTRILQLLIKHIEHNDLNIIKLL